jgi:bla regulator protein blaR1
MIAALTSHTWQSTLFVAVAWLLTLLLRNNGAHTRYWLWSGASLKFFIPISLVVSAAAQISVKRECN